MPGSRKGNQQLVNQLPVLVGCLALVEVLFLDDFLLGLVVVGGATGSSTVVVSAVEGSVPNPKLLKPPALRSKGLRVPLRTFKSTMSLVGMAMESVLMLLIIDCLAVWIRPNLFGLASFT